MAHPQVQPIRKSRGPVPMSRKVALEVGDLIDVSDQAAVRGFPYPTAITRAACEAFVTWMDAEPERYSTYDESHAIWSVLDAAIEAVMRRTEEEAEKLQQFNFKVNVEPRDSKGRPDTDMLLTFRIGPDDDGCPAITISADYEE